MTFDPQSLLKAPPPPNLTVDGLITALKKLQSMGMGGAGVRLPTGEPINAVDLVAQDIELAHFVVMRK